MLRSRYIEREPAERKIKAVAAHPMLVPVIGFVALILIGTLLLWLPFSTHKGISLIDALFTATSASCVTGLSVVDIGSTFTLPGLTILMVLMQVGGIGVMVLATLFMLVSRAKMGFGQQSAFMSSYTVNDTVSPVLVLKRVVIVTVLIELTGAAMLFSQFPHLELGERIFSSLFHAVSAYCNAGFCLYPDSIIQFQHNTVINLSIVLLVTAGGFGFLTLAEIFSLHRQEGHVRRLSLHTRLVLIVLPILTLGGMGWFAWLEWDNTMAGIGWLYKLQTALFQSTASRTAGFNSVDISMVKAPVLFVIIILMFIGANPGSCGGGIKTTTAALIGMLGLNRFLGREKTQILGRTVPEETVDRAVRIFVLSIVVVCVTIGLLLVTETGTLHAKEGQELFMALTFEVISAFSTCGLSMGITPDLTHAGKLILSITMFIGRLGPLVLVQAVIRQSQESSYYAEENIMVG